MRVLALDIGDVRIGVAASDAAGVVASPVKVLPTSEVMSGAKTWKRLVEDIEPELLLCGLPLSLDGEEHAQAQDVRAKAGRIADALGLPLEYVDERLSSAEAKRVLAKQGLSERQMRGKVDMVAAALILQAWLDSHGRKDDSQ